MMRSRNVRRFVRKIVGFLLIVGILSFLFTSKYLNRILFHLNENEDQLPEAWTVKNVFPSNFRESWYEGIQFDMPEIQGKRKDWHDYEAMMKDLKRVGPGENGSATINTDKSVEELEKRMALQNGFNAFVSNMISVNRSLPDVRHEKCRSKLYLSKLPTVSIVIPCRNEYVSVLQRTLHSIVNRTPKELLKEIIIVDDNSNYGYSVDEMILYVNEKFPNLVKFIRFPERKGLIYARQAGAKIARGDVLVFFDSHIECNSNWLPPLLEPIALDYRISTCPIIDTISHDTFEYSGSPTSGWRGGFDWNLHYKHMKLRLDPEADRSKPFKNPIMMGGLFAISRRFFWKLGGYDEGLDIWGSEQFELSFKIWMCGGLLLDIPCSRVAHIFRGPWERKQNSRDYNFLATNIKRVAEVWMDDYKHHIYAGEPETYVLIDEGDLSERHALRQRLNCKSFEWFLEVVASDVLEEYPINPPPDYANGALQSVKYPQYCLDTLNGGKDHVVGVFYCAKDLVTPHRNQYWHLTWRHEIRNHRTDYCLDLYKPLPNAPVHMLTCHGGGGNQYWSYDKQKQYVQHGSSGFNCLEIVKKNNAFEVIANRCQERNEEMRWKFGFINDTDW